MANELTHKSQGTVLTQAEYENIDAHVLNSQATGDLIYASSASQLSRLGIGTATYFLKVVGGVPAWSNTLDSPTIQGTIAAGTGLTMPAFTLGGDINCGEKQLTNVALITGRSTTGVLWIYALKTAANTGVAFGISTLSGTDVQTTRCNFTGGVDVAIANWLNVTHTGIILTASSKLNPVSGVAGFSVVSTALTLGSLGSIILPQGNMSGAASDAARDALAGNVAGAHAWDAADLSFWARHTDGTWKHVHLA